MFAACRVWSAAVLLLVLSLTATYAQARFVDDGDLADTHALGKRTLFDASCTGVYDRHLLLRLSRVCDDCYNVFREPNVSTECRSNCYNNLVFRQCMEYIVPNHLHEEHRLAVQRVGK
uniref:Crustacean hyperglycemic hormone n=1 Tax=Metapenaeus ensis TaxID=32278 RepID=E2RUJ9_METEN|nr:crustacean hyperglycemic hormone precursor [Metapenaeus ensis]